MTALEPTINAASRPVWTDSNLSLKHRYDLACTAIETRDTIIANQREKLAKYNAAQQAPQVAYQDAWMISGDHVAVYILDHAKIERIIAGMAASFKAAPGGFVTTPIKIAFDQVPKDLNHLARVGTIFENCTVMDAPPAFYMTSDGKAPFVPKGDFPPGEFASKVVGSLDMDKYKR